MFNPSKGIVVVIVWVILLLIEEYYIKKYYQTKHRSFIHKWFKRIITVAAVVLIVWFYSSSTFNIKDFIAENLLQTIFTSIVLISFYFIIKDNEDWEKIQLDSSDLKDKYKGSKGRFLTYENDSVYPSITLWVNYESNKKLEFKTEIEEYIIENNIILSNSKRLFDAHSNSTIFNDYVVRLKSCKTKEKTGNLELIVQKTRYYNHLLTNAVLDFPISKGFTIREYFEPGPLINNFEKTVFSNHIGINALVCTEDGYFVFPKRTNKLHLGKNMLGVGVSASMKWKFYEKYQGKKNILSHVLIDEFKDELIGNLMKDIKDYIPKMKNVHLIALGRDLYHGGKPQFYYVIYLDYTFEKLNKLFKFKNRTMKKAKLKRGSLNAIIESKKLIKIKPDNKLFDFNNSKTKRLLRNMQPHEIPLLVHYNKYILKK